MLFELPQQPVQLTAQPWVEGDRLHALIERRFGAGTDDLVETPEHLVALQPEAGEVAEIGVTCPGLARMAPRQNAQIVTEP